MKIQELSKRTGLTEYTLRYYEKEGLVDHRHVNRDENNYRNYADEVLERLNIIKKFQRLGCSLTELKQILNDRDKNLRSNDEVILWIRNKIVEVKKEKREFDQILHTLNGMLEYRVSLSENPKIRETHGPSMKD